MAEYFPCSYLDLLADSEASEYFGQYPKVKPVANKCSQISFLETMEILTMALKPRLANCPVTDSEGYCTAEIADITYLEDGESEYSGEQFLFDFITPGIQRPINLKVWTGVKINPERYQINGSKTKELNKLTRVCLAVGLVTETDLKTIANEADLDKLAIGEKLEALKGQQVRFKLLKAAKGKGLSQIDLDTLQLVKLAAAETVKV